MAARRSGRSCRRHRRMQAGRSHDAKRIRPRPARVARAFPASRKAPPTALRFARAQQAAGAYEGHRNARLMCHGGKGADGDRTRHFIRPVSSERPFIKVAGSQLLIRLPPSAKRNLAAGSRRRREDAGEGCEVGRARRHEPESLVFLQGGAFNKLSHGRFTFCRHPRVHLGKAPSEHLRRRAAKAMR